MSILRSTRRLRHRRGFSALELLVVVGIILVLISIFVPYILKNREENNRFRCSDNLRQLYAALGLYAHLNHGDYPRVIYDAIGNPNGYTCYSGADGGDPFSKNTTVKSNDVTASLWLLVRSKLARPVYFICPSTHDDLDNADDAAPDLALRGNFRGPDNLSYSYASPFSSALGYKLNDTRRADFALMADKNPGKAEPLSDAAGPAVTAPPLTMSLANSNNHRKAGQNVLYTDSHVEFKSQPYCGVGDEVQPELHDNVYTALAAKPLERGQYLPKYGNGVLGRDVGPAWESDSYLVPTSTDQVPGPVVMIATQPASQPVTTQPAPKPPGTQPTTVAVSTRPSTAPATTQAGATTVPSSRPATSP